MHALRSLRTRPRAHHLVLAANIPTGQSLLTSRLYASKSSNTVPHTPDTYKKDDDPAPPSSPKTHVVSENLASGSKTARPFETPGGEYSTVDPSKPYESPTNEPHEEESKLKYGGKEPGGGGPKDVHGGHDSPQGEAGKKGRQ